MFESVGIYMWTTNDENEILDSALMLQFLPFQLYWFVVEINIMLNCDCISGSFHSTATDQTFILHTVRFSEQEWIIIHVAWRVWSTTIEHLINYKKNKHKTPQKHPHPHPHPHKIGWREKLFTSKHIKIKQGKICNTIWQ